MAAMNRAEFCHRVVGDTERVQGREYGLAEMAIALATAATAYDTLTAERGAPPTDNHTGDVK
jgi:hypothetical protein